MTQRMDEDVRNFVLSHRKPTEQKEDVMLTQVEKYYRAGLTSLAEKMSRQRGLQETLSFSCRSDISVVLVDKPFIRPGSRVGEIMLKGNPLRDAYTLCKALYIVKTEDYIGKIPDAIVDVILKNKDRYGSFYVAKPSTYKKPLPDLSMDPLLLATGITPNWSEWTQHSEGITFHILGVWGDDWFDLELDCLRGGEEDAKD